MNLDILEKLINENLEWIINVRRDIHANPELGMNEHRTSKIIYENLQGLGLKVQQGIGKTGVVALLEGKEQGRTILLRADMDALPINELTDLPFKSKNKNVMHACGHDVHTSILLCTAKILSGFKDEIKGNIKFVFQPAEECNPTGGANNMIEDGVLENPKVDAAVALHVWDMPLGSIGIKKGAIMAQSDRIYIKVKGKSAHGSTPHQGLDAIVAAAHVITALQTIVSRNINPLDSAVLTLGVINGGYRYNVIADEVNLEGTVRSFSHNVADEMPERIDNIIKNVCRALGCDYEFKYVKGYPLTYNDETLTENVIGILKQSLGEKSVVIAENPATIGEDFSYFNKHVPCTFMWLGCKSEINKDCCILHSPNFICDEESIPIGIKALCDIVLAILK
ncbi:M20 metallopeptidase family protein [Clostridium lundense]|uniref:M20 metallopeptidase family protein n=1 Tax=Clostridium lundense TaxID=319475 RepID=UPI000A5D1ED1|nr:M20 family metallopeptidase [Clostridium lundense]